MLIRLLILVAVLAATGWLHGRWTDRWSAGGDVETAAAALPSVPLLIGDWEGRDITREEAPAVYRASSPQIVRRYVNRTTGAAVGLLVTCGRPSGMIIEHNPKECYKQLGFEETGDGQKVPVGADAARADFYAHTFVKTTPAATSRVRVLWAWSDGRSWSFPDRPRVAFARTPVLYKMYVTRDMASEDEPLADDATRAFLNTALPDITAALGADS